MAGRLVLTKMGGVNKASKLLDRPYTTVHYWWEKDMIPSSLQKEVLAICKANRIKINEKAFF